MIEAHKGLILRYELRVTTSTLSIETISCEIDLSAFMIKKQTTQSYCNKFSMVYSREI